MNGNVTAEVQEGGWRRASAFRAAVCDQSSGPVAFGVWAPTVDLTAANPRARAAPLGPEAERDRAGQAAGTHQP